MEEKMYFNPGDLVRLKHDIPNSPKMLVVGKQNFLFKQKDTGNINLRGIKCRWFTNTGELQEAIFNTKDLILSK